MGGLFVLLPKTDSDPVGNDGSAHFLIPILPMGKQPSVRLGIGEQFEEYWHHQIPEPKGNRVGNGFGLPDFP